MPPFETGDPAVDNMDSIPNPYQLGLLNVRYVASDVSFEVEGLLPTGKYGADLPLQQPVRKTASLGAGFAVTGRGRLSEVKRLCNHGQPHGIVCIWTWFVGCIRNILSGLERVYRWKTKPKSNRLLDY